jgi:hypothetical protein
MRAEVNKVKGTMVEEEKELIHPPSSQKLN